MAQESTIEVSLTPWYSRICMCLINRNRISPEKFELADCDFFIVGPGRTLRILRRIQSSDEFYETPCDRPESINENFISRWTKRPHSLNKCRCSFRQSSFRLSPEREKISAEINRIRTSLCEAEKTGQDIDELEKRISLNLNCFNDPVTMDLEKNEDGKSTDNTDISVITTGDSNNGELITKNKIVKDLEKYIDVMLKEVLNDTMKFISDADDILSKSRRTLDKRENNNFNVTDDGSLKSSLNISFEFLPDYHNNKNNIETENEEINADEQRGYVNHAFIGTAHDPDCLNFDLRKPIDNIKHLDKVDCVDSGINSVETVEFPLEPELSLEQSLMKIIDAKFGRTPLTYSWENLNTLNNIVDKEGENVNENIETTVCINKNDDIDLITSLNKDDKENKQKIADELMDTTLQDLEELDTPIIDSKFDELKLELKSDSKASTLNDESVKKLNSMAVLCEKLTLKLSKKGNNNCKNRDDNEKNDKFNLECKKKKRNVEGVEMEDYRATWKVCTESNASPCDNESPSPNDLVVFRRNRKPIIVFLHGFGSSAEVFEYQLQYFAAMGYPCIAPEMVGHGMSSTPNRLRDYRFEKLLNDIEAVLHHYAFKPGRKCVLVAHNYGCSFATALASKYENEIRQLVLISGGGPTPLAPPTTEGAGQCCLRMTLSPLLMCGLRRNLLYSARGRQHPYCGVELEDQWPSHMKYILNGMIWPDGDYIFHRRITTPTLLIHGLRDNKVSLVQECQMERTILKAFLEAIPTAGHIPMTDSPEQVNHMIHCFIDLWKKKC